MLNTALARRLFTTVFLLALVATPAFRRGAEAAPITYYVSKNGSNADGRSWATAWNELNQINWTAVQPGDTILVDGGSTSMTYTSTLTYGKSGTSTAPITIQLASDAGRNGKAIIFGGRSTLLPYCGQSGYVLQSARNAGIVTGGNSWIVLDGTKWGGFDVHGHNQHGIQLSSSASNLTFRHLDIWDNGSSVQSGSTWYPDQKGVSLSGSNITFERVEIHDNGQDAFQSGGGVSNLTIRRSWLYNSRPHPNLADEPFNECRHSDGIQIYGGGVQSGITVEDSIFGPSFMQGFILGDSNTCPGGSACATINNVTVRNSLIVGGHGTSGNAGLLTKPDPANPPRNYVIDRVTSVRDVGDQWWNMSIDGSGHTVTNSIFVGGYALHVAGSPSASNNCSWQVNDQNNIAVDADPRFVDATYAGVGTGFADFDFSLGGGTQCAGRGTTITSVAVLKGAGSATPTPTPIPPTATPTRTPTPTATPLPLAFEAEACTIAAPFTVTSGTPTYVSQSVETVDPAQGGRAACTFSITTAGDYLVKMLVNAASTSADSVFLNVDAEPTSPTGIWDIGPTTGYEWRTATWRGTGTVSQPQFNPKVFTLSAGSHQLIVRGREADTRLDRTSIELNTAPTATPTSTPTATRTSTPTATPTPTPQTFEAESCTITSPFTVTTGSPTYVSQSVETTDPTLGGKAACTFIVATAGNYLIDMVVDAPTTASNSLFVNVDAEPTSPTMIWDIVSLTTGFQTRTVSWRGTGTETSPQYNPKVFTLSTGSHQLIVRGREANVKVDKITIRSQ